MQNPNGHFPGHPFGHPPPGLNFPSFAGAFPPPGAMALMHAAGMPLPHMAPPNANGGGHNQNPVVDSHAQKSSPWIEYKTPDGRPYYFNQITNQTVWEKPEEMSRSAGGSQQPEQPTSGQGQWTEYKTDDGKVYYYNPVTKVTTWTMPPEMMKKKQQSRESTPLTFSEHQNSHIQLPSSTPPPVEKGNSIHISNKGSSFFSALGGNRGQPSPGNTDEDGENSNSNSNLPSSTPISEPSMTPPTSKGHHHHHDSSSAKSDFEEFKEILLEKKIASNASWENCLKYVAHEPRFNRFRSHPERKTFFNQYKTSRIREEKEEQRNRLKAAREALERYLRSSDRMNSSLRYRPACDLFRDVQIWNAVPDVQRREIFEDALTEITKKEREEAKELRKRNMTVLSDVLDSMNLITFRTTWSEAQQMLLDNPVFAEDAQLLSMDKEDALIVFQDHIRQLEADEETERANERKMRVREQRRNREAFLKLLDELHASGKLNSLSKWVTLYHDISADSRFESMLNQPLNGSTPLDLFKFYVEDLKARYEDEKQLIRNIMKSADFTVTATTEFSEFVELLSQDPRSGKLDSGNVKLMHEKLVDREREKEKDRLREEARAKKKLEMLFIGALERMSPPLREDSTWEEVRPLISKEEAFGAISSEEERVAIFEDVVRSLVENCTHRHNYKSSHGHGGSKHSSSSHHKSGSLDRSSHHQSSSSSYHHHHSKSGGGSSRDVARRHGTSQQQSRSGRRSRSSSVASEARSSSSLSDISEESGRVGGKAKKKGVRSRSRSTGSDVSSTSSSSVPSIIGSSDDDEQRRNDYHRPRDPPPAQPPLGPSISSSSRHLGSSKSIASSSSLSSSRNHGRGEGRQTSPPVIKSSGGHRRSRDRQVTRSPSPLPSKRSKGVLDHHNNGSSYSSSRSKARDLVRADRSPPTPEVIVKQNEPDIEDLELQRKMLLRQLADSMN